MRTLRGWLGAIALAVAGCSPVAPQTPLLRFVEGAEIQVETDAQACLLASALGAIATVPAGDVVAMRFGRPPMTAAGVLTAHLVPPVPAAIDNSVETYDGASDARTQAALVALTGRAVAGRSCPAS